MNLETNRLERLFLTYPDAVAIFKEHPDIILMDCTYKTNRFCMPLLNICVVAGGKKTIQVALCFLSGEKEDSYRWAMHALKELMIKYGISATKRSVVATLEQHVRVYRERDEDCGGCSLVGQVRESARKRKVLGELSSN